MRARGSASGGWRRFGSPSPPKKGARCATGRAHSIDVTPIPHPPSYPLLTVGRDDDGDDEAVDAQDTRHDHGDDRLHHQLGPHDAHGGDPHAGLGGAVGGAHACVIGGEVYRGVGWGGGVGAFAVGGGGAVSRRARARTASRSRLLLPLRLERRPARQGRRPAATAPTWTACLCGRASDRGAVGRRWAKPWLLLSLSSSPDESCTSRACP